MYPYYEPPGLDQWVIGYQYYGGVTNWVNPLAPGPTGMGRSWSPVKLSTSQPHWALAADVIMRTPGSPWGYFVPADRDLFQGVPPHGRAGVKPAGSNHVYVDGSARWIKVEELRYLHSFNSRPAWFYQDLKDLPAAFLSQVDATSMKVQP